MFGFGFKLLLTLFLATSQGQTPLVVRTDLGGQIGARSAQIWLLGNRPIEIVGWCESACTMYLAAPNVCVTKDAHLVFHGPSWFGVPMGHADFEIASRFIAEHYPPSLAEWYLREGRFGRYGISGAEIIANGWARECG